MATFTEQILRAILISSASKKLQYLKGVKATLALQSVGFGFNSTCCFSHAGIVGKVLVELLYLFFFPLHLFIMYAFS